MRNRLVKARPNSTHQTAFPIHQDASERDSPVSASSTLRTAQAGALPDRSTPTKSPRRPSHERPSVRTTLTLASEGITNAAMSRAPATGGNLKPLPTAPAQYSQQQQIPARMNSTIRTVTSFDDKPRLSDDSSIDGTVSLSVSRNSGFSSSITSNASMSSASQENEGSKPSPNGRSRPSPTVVQDGFLGVPGTNSARSSVEIPVRESSLSATANSSTLLGNHANHSNFSSPEIPGPTPTEVGEAHLSNGWDSTVGKAGLGKTGRVINKLVSEKEALKREIKFEQLRAEESKQTAKLLEDKLDRTVSDYESRLLEANVTKTLLARKERQVESLQSTVDFERKRAVDASERERMWKEEMEKVRVECQRKVDEATNYATLMEGRYNAISSHWRDQGKMVKEATGKMEVTIAELREERRQDDEKIVTLQALCDQQDSNIRELLELKEALVTQHERYREEQERVLHSIKTKAKEREEEQQRMIEETREALNKLRWALNVKENIPWAQ